MSTAKILIVEDSGIVAVHIQSLLRNLGYDVVAVVAAGEKAVALAGESQPDLVLMDIQLAGEMDGVEAAEEIRRRYGIPAIYLTAYSDTVTLERAKITEPLGYIVKPFEQRDLQIAIEMALYRHRMEQELRASEKKYRRLVENLNEIVYTIRFADDHVQGQVDFVSAQVESIVGYKPQEFIEDPGLWMRIIHPEDRAPLRETTQQIIEQKTRGTRLYRLRHKHTGRYHWMEDKVEPQLDEAGNVVGQFGVARDITERYQAQAKIRKLSNAVEQTADAIIITDPDGVIEYVNPAFETTTGYSREDVVGATPRILQRGDYDRSFYDQLCQTIQSGESFRGVFVNRRKDGTAYYEARTISPVRDNRQRVTHYISTGRNITERKRLEQRLEAVYRLGQELTLLHDEMAVVSRMLEVAVDAFHCTYVGCGLVDPAREQLQLIYRLVGAAERRAPHKAQGRAEPQKVSRQFSLAEEHLFSHVMNSREAIHIPDVTQDQRVAPVPGTAHEGAEYCVPMKLSSQVIGVLTVRFLSECAFSDADARLLQTLADQTAVALENARLYQIKQEQYRRLQESQTQLVQAAKMGAIGRLAASTAHEINNPLQSVQGCLTLTREALQERHEPQAIARYLDVVENEIDRIATIVSRMRDFYRPSGQEMRATNVPAVLDEVLELSRQQLEHNHIEVRRQVAPNLPHIEANPDHLKQVFLNLILNAIDAMPTGGILSLRLENDEIVDSKTEQKQAAVRVEFADSGEGISPEALDRLFEPFFTTKTHGSGLGLSISYSIITAHHGEISVSSDVGQGTNFTILLPQEQQSDS